MHDKGIRSVLGHHAIHHRFEELEESFIADSRFQRDVECVVLSIEFSNLIDPTSAWKEIIAILMKTNSHHSVAQIECLFDSIAMVDVNVEVEHARIDLEELKDGQDDIIYITES